MLYAPAVIYDAGKPAILLRIAAALAFALILLALAFSRPVAAQDVLQIPEKQQALPPETQTAPAPSEETEKTALAVKYFNLCTERTLLEQEFDVRALFCSCSADRALKNLTTAQMAALAEGKSTGIDEKEFSIQVQTPCLSFMIEDIEYRRCFFYNGNQFVTPEGYENMCRCMGSSMGDFVRTYGSDLMTMILERKPNIGNPMHAIGRSREYKEEYAKTETRCLNKYSGQ